MSDYFNCPNCGAEVPIRALVCPSCGADEDTGWSDETLYDGLDLPEIEETGIQQKGTPLFQNRRFLCVVAIVTILVFIWMYII